MGKGNAEIEEKPNNGKRKNVLFFNFGSLLMFISEFFKKTQTHKYVGSWKNMGSGCFFWGMARCSDSKKNKISNWNRKIIQNLNYVFQVFKHASILNFGKYILWRENVMDNFPSPNLCVFWLILINFGVLGERHRISPSLTSSTAAKMALGDMADLRRKRAKTSVGCQTLLPSHPSKFLEMSGYFGAFISRF